MSPVRDQLQLRRLRRLPRSFYARPTLQVAPELLGKYLIRVTKGQTLIGRIVEVEAYRSQRDPASHAYRGRTRRNEVMFGEPGHAYVYFTYGMHFCMNIVTERDGVAGAVLLRGIEPLRGLDRMRQRRGSRVKDEDLSNGPAKLCEAFAIGRNENGLDLLGDEIYLMEAPGESAAPIARSPRIGIGVATDKRWRFFLRGNPWVSRSPAARKRRRSKPGVYQEKAGSSCVRNWPV
jgi:DNA-3-methyladenine glycosylase